MQENEIRANFAKNVKELRISHKMNQIQFGEKISYSSKAISKWENGDVLPDIITLKMIADYFNIGVDDLISNRDVVHKSHRKKNHLLITLISSFLAFFVAAIVFLTLSLVSFEKAWMSFIIAIPTSAVVLIVFTSLWYKRIHIMLSSIYLVIGLAITSILIVDISFWWEIALISLLLVIMIIIFFSINFKKKKSA